MSYLLDQESHVRQCHQEVLCQMAWDWPSQSSPVEQLFRWAKICNATVGKWTAELQRALLKLVLPMRITYKLQYVRAEVILREWRPEFPSVFDMMLLNTLGNLYLFSLVELIPLTPRFLELKSPLVSPTLSLKLLTRSRPPLIPRCR